MQLPWWSSFRLLNQIFEAGIAITALSLFIRSLSFNLRDRVAQSFSVIMASVVVVYSGEAIAETLVDSDLLGFWLRFQWVGLVILPAALFHFADALLATTGRPSRGRRRRVVYLGYLITIAFLFLLPNNKLITFEVITENSFSHLLPGSLLTYFTAYYILSTVISGWLIWRAYKRTRLTVSRRRLLNLFVGAIALAFGTYPYIYLGSGLSNINPFVFLGAVLFANLLIFLFLVLMAYSVAFFGVSWPDRIVRSRLLKWMLRGPVTLFIVLTFMTVAYRVGDLFGAPFSIAIPIVIVITILFMEHVITLVFPYWEKWFFHGGDRHNLDLVHSLSERLITIKDLEQFLETILGAVCDQFQVSVAFIVALSDKGLEKVVQVGDNELLNQPNLDEALVRRVIEIHEDEIHTLFSWNQYWLHPIYNLEEGRLLGLLGVLKKEDHDLDDELGEALVNLGQRAALALENRLLQQDMFQAIEKLKPNVEMIQRLRAASRFDQSEILADMDNLLTSTEIFLWVKDALSHYWGGPKLTESPLMRLKIVQSTIEEHQGNPVNALRAILKKGVEQVKPEGERRFTGEWILYNILDMKFLEGRKVKDIALRLAMSEADLYRKQKVAIDVVVGAIVEMEQEVVKEIGDPV